MNNLISILKSILEEHSDRSILYRRNIAKEYLQILALEFIYSHLTYKELVFYGGSALAHVYNLPRLSEDLDFVDINKKVNIDNLAEDLKKYFLDKFDIKISSKVQKFRIYLKFPIMHDLKLADNHESDFLFLKVEIFNNFDFCSKYNIEIKPLFKYNQSVLIKTFDLSTLMSTKIRAILYRKWEKTNQNKSITVKGRDYFDLMWYLEKGITPNIECLEIKDIKKLKDKLIEMINQADPESIRLDLENFIANEAMVDEISKHIKQIIKDYLKKW